MKIKFDSKFNLNLIRIDDKDQPIFEIEPKLSFSYPYLLWVAALKRRSVLCEIRSNFWCEKLES